MNRLLRITLSIILVAMAATPAWADGGKSGLPKKMSGFDGWHGAKMETKEAPGCRLVLPRDFGKKLAELKLLQELASRGQTVDLDLNCAQIVVTYAALDQLKRLAVEDQNHDAAELIVFAEKTGKPGLDGEVAERFGAAYLFPVLLGYNKLAEIVTPQEEGRVAANVCEAYYNPSSGDLDLDIQGLKARLAAQKMQSFVQKIDRECARLEKEINDTGPR